MKNAVVYARYSCDNQTEQSIEGQMRVCREYAERHEIVIVDTYIDRAMSGTNDNRPDFQRMIKDSAKREWEIVLVYKLDRFSRNKYETAIHKKTLRDNGVKVVSAMENIPDTPEGIILESLLEGMNQYYSAELSQKVRRGMRETRNKGLYQGGRLPYGYKLDGRRIVIDEKRADVVRYIYDRFSKGVFVREIIEDLTAKGVLCNGKPFPLETIYKILKNERYSGTYTMGDEVISNMFPAIIPVDLYERVRKIVNQNRYGRRSIKTDYLLRFKVECGYCGKKASASSALSETGRYFRYYKCDSRKTCRHNCQLKSFPKEFLETLIVDSIAEKLSEPSIMNSLVAELMKAQNDNSKNNTALIMLKKEKVGVDIALDNIVKSIESGLGSKTTHQRMLELEHQQEELEKQIRIEENREIEKLSEKEIRTFYKEGLKLEPRMLIACLVKKIVLYNEKIEIYYNNPLNISPDNSRGFLLYRGPFTIIREQPGFELMRKRNDVPILMYV